MRVGPMPLIAADKLMRILRKHGHEAQLEMSGDVFTPEEQKTAHPRTESPADLCYVEFDEAYLEFVRADLVRLALISDDEMVSTGDELDGTDWMCPKCGKAFDHPGQCPTHNVALITFEDFAKGKTDTSGKLSPLTIVIVGVVLFIAWKIVASLMRNS